jgi:hypothetical protein
VEYAGKAWAISTLAMSLLGGGSVANGFANFCYGGETLQARRSRLEREDKQDESQAAEMPKHTVVQEPERGIIGSDGQMLSPSTWRALRRAGTKPSVAEWARRVANGESMENIAREGGLKVPTVKQYIRFHRLYFVTCAKNGIVPEGDVDV